MPVDDAEQHEEHDPVPVPDDGAGGGEPQEQPPDDGQQFMEVIDTGGQLDPRTKMTKRPEDFDEDVRHKIAYTFFIY